MATANLLDLPAAPPAPRERGQNLFDANRQWAWRPDDQRFLDLDSLAASVRDRKERSKEYPAYKTVDLKPEYVSEGPLAGNLFVAKWGDKPITFSNWSFNQYNSIVGGPNVGWLRDMPAPIAAHALAASMQYRGRMGSDSLSKLYITPPNNGDPNGELRALTSTSYGRIYDAEVVSAVERINQDGRWTVPLKAYQGKNSKLATTLYASDRDIWMFLVDEQRGIEIDGELFYRGFITWNSEVGSATFGLKTFLYRYVCQNRIIWDAVQVRQLSIRHTNKAPERFIREAAPILAGYSEMGTLDLVENVHQAKATSIAKDIKGAEDFLRARGITQEASRVVVNLAQLDGGAEPDANGRVKSTDPTNLWNLSQGLSAYARGIANQDERVALETKAGELLTTKGRRVKAARTPPHSTHQKEATVADEPLSREEMRTLVASALRHLPQAERNVLRRRLGIHAPDEAWSHARIAGDLGLTVRQVQYLESHGLRRLRSMRDRGLVAAYQIEPEVPEIPEGDADDRGAETRPAE